MNPSLARWPLTVVVAGTFFFGLSIALLAIPMSISSHELADEIKRRKPAQQGVKGAEKLLTDLGKKLDPPGPKDDAPILRAIKLPVAVIMLGCCCCVCLVQIVVEPINEMIGALSRLSVYTLAAALIAYGAGHMALAWGLLRQSPIARGWIVYGCGWLNLSQGLMSLLSATPIWIHISPEHGITTAGLGLLITGFWLFTLHTLTRHRPSTPIAPPFE